MTITAYILEFYLGFTLFGAALAKVKSRPRQLGSLGWAASGSGAFVATLTSFEILVGSVLVLGFTGWTGAALAWCLYGSFATYKIVARIREGNAGWCACGGARRPIDNVAVTTSAIQLLLTTALLALHIFEPTGPQFMRIAVGAALAVGYVLAMVRANLRGTAL